MNGDAILQSAAAISHPGAEKALLGLILNEPDHFLRVRAKLTDALEFAETKNRILFQAMLDVVNKGGLPGFVAVKARLEQRKQNHIVDSSYLLECQLEAIFPHELDQTCEIITNAADLRKIKLDHAQFEKDIKEGLTATEIADRMRNTLRTVRTKRANQKSSEIRDLIIDVTNRLRLRDEATAVKTGLSAIDKALCGLPNGSLTIIGARPGGCKSALGFNIAHNVARAGMPVAIFSIEMPKEQVVLRLLSREARIDGERIKAGELSDVDWEIIEAANERILSLPLRILDASDRIETVESIESAVEQMDTKPSLLLIDHAQIMRLPGKRKAVDTIAEVTAISNDTRLMVNRLGVPGILLSQLNRESEKRDDKHKKPKMSDLKSSGSLEQDADHILVIQRGEARPVKEIIPVHLIKNRHGRDGQVLSLGFDAAYQDFYDIRDTK